MKNRILSIILVLILSSCLFVPPLSISAASNTIQINNENDFVRFSKQCKVDSWSKGKIVSLNADLSLHGIDFSPIPIFEGTFQGNGHTISNVSCAKNGSHMGLFRYNGKDGRIENLNVTGTIQPEGTQNYIGGLVGENSGTIDQCSFDGTVSGDSNIGGLVGLNKASGQVISCSVKGMVSGKNSVGGIIGYNNGYITQSENNASVNTVYKEEKTTTEMSADVGAMVEKYKIKDEENVETSFLEYSDIGGIIGYSDGIVQGCNNNGEIGYHHIGYNIGGVIGRQAGYLLGCSNTGEVNGRKDVGGIVGQMEPYILLNTTASNLDKIKTEINTLTRQINHLISDSDKVGTDIDTHLRQISTYSSDAQKNAKTLADIGTDFIDENVDEINVQAAIISNTIDRLIPAFDALSSGGEDLSEAIIELSDALDNFDSGDLDIKSELTGLSKALRSMSVAGTDIDDASSKLNQALQDLKRAVSVNKPETTKSALIELSEALLDLSEANGIILQELDNISQILSAKPEQFSDLGINVQALLSSLKAIKSGITSEAYAISTIQESVSIILVNVQIDFNSLQKSLNNMISAIDDFSRASSALTGALDDAGVYLGLISDKTTAYLDNLKPELEDLQSGITDSLDSLSFAVSDINMAVSNVRDILKDLSDEDPPEFFNPGDEFRNASNDLYYSLSGISDEMNGLREVLSDGRNVLMSDLSAINNQMNIVLNLIMGKIEGLQNGTENLSDIYLDASEENISKTKQGKVTDSHNYGEIRGDRNVGGIVGAMAIEYTKDPEGDIKKPDSLNFTYRTKAVLQSCINEGKVEAKKDCIGGIVGSAELGTVYGCENYADVTGYDGGYVGAIAGKSDSFIRKSYGKGTISGKKYVGGIAGKGATVTNSYSIVTIEGDEYFGSICGDVNDRENIYLNYYVDNEVGGIDDVGYHNAAEPISYEELKEIANIPKRFISFTVTFVADDVVIDTKEMAYGESTKRIEYPKIPEKNDQYGTWEDIESPTIVGDITVNCVYSSYASMIESEEKNSNNTLALGLAEGAFSDKSVLHIKESNQITAPAPKGIVYDISIANSKIKDFDAVPIRILNEEKKKARIWRLSDGAWEQVKYKNRGKYMCITINGATETIAVQYTPNWHTLCILSGIGVLLLAFGCLIIILKKKPNLKIHP